MQSLTWEEKKLCLSAIKIVIAVRQKNKTVMLKKIQLKMQMVLHEIISRYVLYVFCIFACSGLILNRNCILQLGRVQIHWLGTYPILNTEYKLSKKEVLLFKVVKTVEVDEDGIVTTPMNYDVIFIPMTTGWSIQRMQLKVENNLVSSL